MKVGDFYRDGEEFDVLEQALLAAQLLSKGSKCNYMVIQTFGSFNNGKKAKDLK